jgi:hypothetical protein
MRCMWSPLVRGRRTIRKTGHTYIQSQLDYSVLGNLGLNVIRSKRRGETVHAQVNLDTSVRPLRYSVARQVGRRSKIGAPFRILQPAMIQATPARQVCTHGQLSQRNCSLIIQTKPVILLPGLAGEAFTTASLLERAASGSKQNTSC